MPRLTRLSPPNLAVITSRPEPPNRRQPRVGGELPRLDGLSDRLQICTASSVLRATIELWSEESHRSTVHSELPVLVLFYGRGGRISWPKQKAQPGRSMRPSAGSPSSSTKARPKTLSWSTPNIERQHEQLAVPNRIVLLRSRDAPQHGGLQPRRPEGRANDPRARDISERINAHIDAALFRARDEVWTQFDPLLDK
jgi:hypothetical protein